MVFLPEMNRPVIEDRAITMPTWAVLPLCKTIDLLRQILRTIRHTRFRTMLVGFSA